MSRNLSIVRASSIAAVAAVAGMTGSAHASLTIDLRLTDGSKTAVITPGGKFLVDIWATVSGASTDLPNSYGLSSVNGSIVSQGTMTMNIAGKFGDVAQYKGGQKTTALTPFAKSGEQPGNQVDLDGDGDIDLGAPNQNSAEGFFIARADPQEYFGSPTNAGVAIPGGNGVAWKIGRVEVTLTGDGGPDASGSSLVFLPRRNVNGQIAPEAGLWYDDQGGLSAKNAATGTFVSGAPLVVVIPEPTAAATLAAAALGLLRRRARAAAK